MKYNFFLQKRRLNYKKKIDTFKVHQRVEPEVTPKVNQQELPEATPEEQHQEQAENTYEDQHQDQDDGQLEGEEQLQNVGLENLSDEFYKDAVNGACFLYGDDDNINMNITDLAYIEGN